MIPVFAEIPPPPAVAGAGVDERRGGRIPLDLALVDGEGRHRALGELLIGPTALVFAWYRCPALCGLVGGGLSVARSEIRDLPWSAVTVGIDPSDRPEDALRARTEARADWPYLVGSPEAVAALTRAVGLRATRDRLGQWAHPAVVVVLTPDGRISDYVYGPRPEPGVLRTALLAAADGRVAEASAGWIDTCYSWTPALRAHGAALLSWMRLGTLGIVAAFLGALFHLVRRR